MTVRALMVEEYEAVRDSIGRTRDAAAFILTSKTDLYLVELLTLKVGDVCGRAGQVVEFIEYRRRNRWGGKVMTVAFDAEVRLALADLIQEIKDRGGGRDSYLFSGRDLDKPMTPQRLYAIMNRALSGLGRDVGNRSLRLEVGSKERRSVHDRRMSAIPKGWMKKADIKRLYGVSDVQLRRWLRRGWLPRLRAGVGRGLLVYRPEDIERIKHSLLDVEK